MHVSSAANLAGVRESLLFLTDVSSSSPLVIKRNCSVIIQGLRVRHRVVDGDLYFKRADIPSAESLGDMQRLGRRIACLVEPRLSVEAPAFHDQRVAIPLADGNPSHDGLRSAANSRPSVKICRHKVIASWRITIWLGVWMIFHGGGAAAVFGTPGGRQLASDSSRACAPPARDSTSAFAHG
jgi:hypothetical protein